MKKLTFIIILSILCTIFTVCIPAGTRVIEITALETVHFKEQWEEDNQVEFTSHGIIVNISKHYTSIILTFLETEGNDVDITLTIPEEIISTTVLGNIQSNDNRTITWLTVGNISKISFNLLAFQNTTITIKKTDIILGHIKKSVHNFWNYVEYNGNSNGESTVLIEINKADLSFNVDNQHMIVQYKTDFYGWYYPTEGVSSQPIYYYVIELNNTYRIITNFRDGNSADMKVEVFPGADDGFFNWDAIKGRIANTALKLQISVKKVIIDLFGGPNPTYT